MTYKHIPLITAIGLPVLFIIILAFVTILPNTQISPEYDFVHTDTSEQYNSGTGEVRFNNSYQVVDGKIVKKKIEISPALEAQDKMYFSQIEYKEAPTLYRYDIQANSSQEISFKDAQVLDISDTKKSPDGYSINFEYTNSGIFEMFGSQDNSGYFIKKDKGQKPLTGFESNMYYSENDIKIIGWIIN